MGIYRVRNKTNGKALIGASRDLPAALNRHRAQLRMGGHRNSQLQADWNTHGAEAFEFEIVDTLSANTEPHYDPTDDLRELEKLWLEKLGVNGTPGY